MNSRYTPPLNHFVFPNLTLFELSVAQVEEFRASQLLNFLEASPTLQTVDVKIFAEILLDDVPRERVVVLLDVETLHLLTNDGKSDYNLVTHISCPSVKDTSLTHKKDIENTTLYNIFPAPASWDTIVRLYKRSPIEQVTLEIKMTRYTILTRSLTF